MRESGVREHCFSLDSDLRGLVEGGDPCGEDSLEVFIGIGRKFSDIRAMVLPRMATTRQLFSEGQGWFN